MPLPIEVEDEGGQYKFVGENCSDFIRLISNEVGKVAPFHYTSWQNVPDKFKKVIFPTLFISYEDVEKARTKPPEEVDQQAWEQLINQLFLNPDFRKRSEKNKLNKSKQRYTSFHGSKSYAQRRHMEDIMQEELKRCTQESGYSESVNQIECMECALGQRRGHIRGVGRVVRHLTPDVSSTYPSQQGEWQNQMDERVDSVVKIVIPRPINRQKSLIGVFPTNFPQIGQLIASRSTTVKIGPNRS
ncbi:hypothetical protein R6Q59_015608 [Mikania micrantha]